jgi:hypothetical protein
VPGQGSTFTLTLPLWLPQVETPPSAPEQTAPTAFPLPRHDGVTPIR